MDLITVQSPPALGAPVLVDVVDDLGRPVVGATLVASWRPGLPGTREQTLGVTDSLGRVRWTPDAAGTVALSTSGGEAALHVDGPVPLDAAALLVGLVLSAVVTTLWGLRP